jgi:hypothetical protein
MKRGYQLGPTLLLHLRVKGCPFVALKTGLSNPIYFPTAPRLYHSTCSRPLGSLRSVGVSDIELQDGSTLGC